MCMKGLGIPIRFRCMFGSTSEVVGCYCSGGGVKRLLARGLSISGVLMFRQATHAFGVSAGRFPVRGAAGQGLGSGTGGMSVVGFLLASCPLTGGRCLLAILRFISSVL